MMKLAAASLALAAGLATAASPVVVDANGGVLGFYLGKPEVTDQVEIVTTMGYTATYAVGSAALATGAQGPFGGSTSVFSEFFFASGDCTGQPYAEAPVTSTGGAVARAGNNGVWYIAKDAQPVDFTSLSRLNNNTNVCEAGTFYPGPFREVRENVPSATGVSNDPAVPPLRVEVLEVSANSWRVFYDGFESSGLPGELGVIA